MGQAGECAWLASRETSRSISLTPVSAPCFCLPNQSVITEADDRKGLQDSRPCEIHDAPNHCLRPQLKLLGKQKVTLPLGKSFLDPGATCTDVDDKDISWAVEIESFIHHDKPGRYWVRYMCTDVQGVDAAQKERLVVIVEKGQKASLGRVSKPSVASEAPAAPHKSTASSAHKKTYSVEGEAVLKSVSNIKAVTKKAFRKASIIY